MAWRFLISAALVAVIWQCAQVQVSALLTRIAGAEAEASLGSVQTSGAIALLVSAAGIDPLNPEPLAVQVDLAGLIPGGPGLERVHRDLVRRRPYSGEAHAALAMFMVENAQSGSERLERMRKARQFGRHETAVQYRLVKGGFPAWTRLVAAEQQQVLDAARDGLRHSSAYHQATIATLLEQRGFLAIVCRQLPEKSSSKCTEI